MKLRYNELRECAGKLPLDEVLVNRTNACAKALKDYDAHVAPLKKAMAASKPKKTKAKAKGAPQPPAVAVDAAAAPEAASTS